MKPRTIIALCFLLLLVACTTLSSDEQARLADLMLRMQDGDLSELEQAELRRLLESMRHGSIDWEAIGIWVGSVISSLLGVRIWRGGVHDRKGEPPSVTA